MLESRKKVFVKPKSKEEKVVKEEVAPYLISQHLLVIFSI